MTIHKDQKQYNVFKDVWKSMHIVEIIPEDMK